jgi:hypothetical protein
MYVLKCIKLYIKPGGFTYDVQEAKKYKTRKAAEKDRVGGWCIVKYKDVVNSVAKLNLRDGYDGTSLP